MTLVCIMAKSQIKFGLRDTAVTMQTRNGETQVRILLLEKCVKSHWECIYIFLSVTKEVRICQNSYLKQEQLTQAELMISCKSG